MTSPPSSSLRSARTAEASRADAGDSALATQPPRFFGGLSVFGSGFGAPLSYQLVGEIAAWGEVCKQAAHTLCGLAASLNFRAGVFGRMGHNPMVPAAPEAIAEDSANSLHLVTEGEKQRARAKVRRAQAEFERAQERVQRERAKARAARRERFAQAQRDGLTVRDIAEEAGLNYSHVAEIIRGE